MLYPDLSGKTPAVIAVPDMSLRHHHKETWKGIDIISKTYFIVLDSVFDIALKYLALVYVMKLKVSDINRDGTELDLTEEVTISEEGNEQSVPVSAQLRAFRDGASVIVTGKVHSEIELHCSRCLENYTTGIDSDVNITYLPETESKDIPETHKLSEAELNTGYYTDDIIDISDLLSELVSINVPIKPLCSEECKGLCSHCGTNLNKGRCDCTDEVIDERWSKLKSLLKERKD